MADPGGGSMGSMDPPFHRKSLWLRICKGESTVPLAGLTPLYRFLDPPLLSTVIPEINA